jgi:hypothetical protein
VPSTAPGLGDVVHVALSRVGVTPESVSGWLGTPCGCAERREKLNLIGVWAHRVLMGKIDRARQILQSVMGVKE